jgi:hypothetical protein
MLLKLTDILPNGSKIKPAFCVEIVLPSRLILSTSRFSSVLPMLVSPGADVIALPREVLEITTVSLIL